MHRNCCVCFVKLFQKSGFWSLCCEFPWKRESFDFSHSLGNSPYFIHQNFTSRSSSSFQLANLLSLFIFVPCCDACSSFGAKTLLNGTGKDQKLTTDFVMDLTFWLAKGFDFVFRFDDPTYNPSPEHWFNW